MKALINVKLYDYRTFIDNGYVIFEKEIIEVGHMKDFKGCETVIDGEGKFLLPAFINFHTHMYSAFARGYDFKCAPKSFTETLEKVWWRMDLALNLEEVYWSAVAYGKECLLKGVVGVLDHHASGQIIGSTAAINRGLGDVGLHGVTCFEISDRFQLEEAISENVTNCKDSKGPVGLHASMTLSDETLRKVKSAFGDQPIHCHVSESRDDHVYYTKTPIERLQAAKLLSPNSLLAHCVHITKEDAAVIKDAQGIIVLNPRSNENNGVGDYDYSLFHAAELPIVMGTDGLGADMARSWQTLYYRAKATEGSRDDMSLEVLRTYLEKSYGIYETLTGLRLGVFEPGYRFDALLLDYDNYTPLTEENVFGHVFFGLFDDLRIFKLWSGGKLIMDQYRVLSTLEIPKGIVESFWRKMEVTHEQKS